MEVTNINVNVVEHAGLSVSEYSVSECSVIQLSADILDYMELV